MERRSDSIRVDQNELAALESRLRAIEYGLSKARSHVIQAQAELNRATEIHSSLARLAKEAHAQLTLAQVPQPKRRGGVA